MTGIPHAQMGDVRPAVEPGRDGAELGTVRLSPNAPCPVRSFQTLSLVYTVGRFGLDDSGALRVSHRFVYDGGRLQTEDPAAANYITATTDGRASLAISVEPFGERPWDIAVRVTVTGGFLRPGETITLVYGDRRGGSPGFRMQTFCESAFTFRVAVDACATGQFRPLDDGLAVPVVAGPPVRWHAVLPTLRRPGERFDLGLKAEDLWGNPTDRIAGPVRLEADGAVDGLPAEVRFAPGARAHRVTGLSVPAPGVVRIRVYEAATGRVLAVSNPVVIQAGALASFWGDLHGQSGETVGINPADAYFAFARDLAFLDVCGHQGNDFQITNAFWAHLNALCDAVTEDGRFVAVPGYEWSGNTPVGGDHNVFFRHAGRPIRRSSHAMLTDRSDLDQDAGTSQTLFEALAGEDCVVIAHVGGRPADVGFAHDPRLKTAVEVHSDWGTFEWIMTDSLARGHRVGLVCNSDGHKGRPGASYPGAATFGAYGGLTCFLAPTLDRASVFECLRRRRHYGTTGCRLHLDVRVRFAAPAVLYARDPAVFDDAGEPGQEAMMGDIVATAEETATLTVTVVAQAPVERIDVLSGTTVVHTARCYGAADLGDRMRILWQGAEYRGRGRQTRWHGRVRVEGAAIRAIQPINAWNPERLLTVDDTGALVFDTVTTGNVAGADLWLDAVDGRLEDAVAVLDSNHVRGQVRLGDLGIDDHVLDAGGLERQLRVRRLPTDLTETTCTVSTPVPLAPTGDTPLWVRITTVDGHRAWSSPVYVFRR